MTELRMFHVGIALIMLFSSVMASSLTLDFERNDETAYFCNPCYYDIQNESGSVASGRTAYGVSSVVIADVGNAENLLIISKAQINKVNISDSIMTAISGDLEVPVVFDRINNNGKIGFVITNTLGYFGSQFGTYSYQKMKNITLSMGFTSFGAYASGGNHSLASTTTALTAYANYDYLFVQPEYLITNANVVSLANAMAIKYAVNGGTKLITSASQYENIYGIGFTNESLNINLNANHHLFWGSIVDETSEFASSTLLKATGETYGSNKVALYENYIYPFDYEPYHYMWMTEASFGSPSKENFIMVDTDGLSYNQIASAYKYSDLGIIAPDLWIRRTTLGSQDHFSGVYSAMMYYALRDETPSDEYDISIKTYEGSEGCGEIAPLPSLMCCIEGRCDDSSALETQNIQYSSSVVPISNAEITGRGDATEKIVYWDSQYEYESAEAWDELPAWIDYFEAYSSSSTGDLRWYLYGDKNLKTQRISLVGTRGTADSDEHILLNYEFFDTDMDTSHLTNESFYIAPMNANNSGELAYSYAFGLIRLDTCDAENYWNFSFYYGVNETHFKENNVSCTAGAISRDTSSAYVPFSAMGFNASEVEWQYGYAPDFANLFDSSREITGSDQRGLIFMQSNKYGNKYNWLRLMTLAKFKGKVIDGVGAATDTGAFYDLESSKMSWTYEKLSGGMAYLTGSGNVNMTCYAPTGYYFVNESGDYAAQKTFALSVFRDVSVAVQLQSKRNILMAIHVYSDESSSIDGAICSIAGFPDSISTNGYCYFENIKAGVSYNVSVRTTGAYSKEVIKTFEMEDYYDSSDADNNGIKCGNFDGNLTLEFNVDKTQLELYSYVRTEDDNTPVINAVVDIDGIQCKTGTDGMCMMRIPEKLGSGSASYDVLITKFPQIVDFSVNLVISNLDCNPESFECSYIFPVKRNATYPGDVNDDYSRQIAFSASSAVSAVMQLLTSQMVWAMIIIMVVAAAGYNYMGAFGGLIGFGLGMAGMAIVGWIPSSALILVILIGFLAFFLKDRFGGRNDGLG